MIEAVDMQHKLAAVPAADVAGFARLTETDDEGTLKSPRRPARHLRRSHRAPSWRIANTATDSVLTELASVTDAVRCAVEARRALGEADASLPSARRVLFRIGISSRPERNNTECKNVEVHPDP